jgi:cytochrome c
MDSFEVNKIAGALLGVLLFVMGLNIVSGALFAPKKT